MIFSLHLSSTFFVLLQSKIDSSYVYLAYFHFLFLFFYFSSIVLSPFIHKTNLNHHCWTILKHWWNFMQDFFFSRQIFLFFLSIMLKRRPQLIFSILMHDNYTSFYSVFDFVCFASFFLLCFTLFPFCFTSEICCLALKRNRQKTLPEIQNRLYMPSSVTK